MVRVSCAIILIVGLMTGGSNAQGSKSQDSNRSSVSLRSLPVPIRIDRSYYVNSALCLKCQMQEYEQPFHVFAGGKQTKSEGAFSYLTQAIHRNDVGTVRSVSDEKRLGGKNVSLDRMVDAYGKMLAADVVGDDMSKLRVVAHIYAGMDHLFIWGIDGPSEFSQSPALRRAFRFVEQGSDLFSWDASPPDTLTCLLTDVMQHKAEKPEKFGIPSKRQFKYEYPNPDDCWPSCSICPIRRTSLRSGRATRDHVGIRRGIGILSGSVPGLLE